MAGRSKLEELGITRQELKDIGEALKKDEFRKLLNDYVEEVTDPENKKKFQEEVTQFEKERGYDVTFVNPEPGYVIKTSVDDEKKAFINVCFSDKIKRPSSVTSARDGTYGKNWSVPYSQAPPREDLDNAGVRCVVYDVVFHPEALKLADWNIQFRNMLNDTALDAVEKNFNVALDRKNLKFPKMKYKGMAVPTVIRKKTSDYHEDNENQEFNDLLSKMQYPYEEPPSVNVPKTGEKKVSKDCADKTPYTTPKYLIKHRNVVDFQEFTNDRNSKFNATVPKEIVVEIELPLLSSTSETVLDVTEKALSLVSEKPAKYKLFIALPYSVDENSGKAKFDKSKHKLIINLPLKNYSYAPFTDYGREDSGVESDAGPRTPESSSGEDETLDNVSKKSSPYNSPRRHIISEIEEIKEENGNERSNLNSSVSVLDNEVFRTNMSASKFLDADKHYSFPSFTCNLVDDLIIFTLHVKNVDPDSVKHIFLEEFSGIHLKFTSIGSGFFPIHHSFCTKFVSCCINEESVNIETWDNNVIVQIELSGLNLLEYYAGVNEDTLVKHDLPEPTVIAKKMEELQVSCSKGSTAVTKFEIEVTKCTKEETIVEISSQDTKSVFVSSEFKQHEKEIESSEENIPSEIENSKSTKRPMLLKCRTLSESSGDEMSFSPSKRGILKRVSRSLSESSADDYTWSSSLDMIMQSGSDSCIPEEEGREVKKTVRFNEIVHQQTYRSNSSIFGQRKKNQRKTRNKKRAQERRASESENSEGEVEKDEREVKTEKYQDEEDEDAHANDEDNQDTNDVADEVFEVQLKLQDEKPSTPKKNSFLLGLGKGKKKNIKKPIPLPVTSVFKKDTSKVDLKNDLIFDLDM